MSNLDDFRLADVVLDEPKNTSQFIERQFPSHYREDGRELIELVREYYRFLESETNQSIYNIRRATQYRDIDTTLERMLVFFKNKFLNGLFFDEDTRFIVKHILDLYRRKGSREGIELFFKLFFEEEVDVYFPSFDMFKPSQSKWKEGKYVQLSAVTNIEVFRDVVNKKIFGSISAAEAFVDNVIFINIRSSVIPVLFISGAKGQFQEFDAIFSLDPFAEYGSVYGSLNRVDLERIDTGLFSGSNRVGDRVNILSSSEGLGAKGRISAISEDFTGEISFTIENGGFGYTVDSPSSDSQVIISEQLLFLENPNREYIIEERIKQTNSFGVEVIGIIVGQKVDSIGVILDDSAPDASDPNYFFETGFDFETIDRDVNITRSVLFITEFNDSSNFEVGELSNAQTVTIVTDIIEDFLNVPIDAANFNDFSLTPFSGANTVNLSTDLNEAFAPQTFEIGTISGLKSINPGSSYQSDVFILVKETLFSRTNIRNQILNIIPTNVNFFIGDIITQQRQFTTFEGDPIAITVRGRIVGISGNNLFITPLTLQQFISSEVQIINSVPTIVPIPIFKEGINIPVTVTSISTDFAPRQLGFNAEIRGDVTLSTGKITDVELVDSGFGYIKGERVLILNTDKQDRLLNSLSEAQSNTEIEEIQGELDRIGLNGDAFGIAMVNNQGKTEGRWVSFESHINQEKVIQDSFFYQDYSYEIQTSVSPIIFEETYRNLVHPSGLKLFSKFAKIETINNDIDIERLLVQNFGNELDISDVIETANTGFNYLILEE
jgi:hypothetical protein